MSVSLTAAGSEPVSQLTYIWKRLFYFVEGIAHPLIYTIEIEQSQNRAHYGNELQYPAENSVQEKYAALLGVVYGKAVVLIYKEGQHKEDPQIREGGQKPAVLCKEFCRLLSLLSGGAESLPGDGSLFRRCLTAGLFLFFRGGFEFFHRAFSVENQGAKGQGHGNP